MEPAPRDRVAEMDTGSGILEDVALDGARQLSAVRAAVLSRRHVHG